MSSTTTTKTTQPTFLNTGNPEKVNHTQPTKLKKIYSNVLECIGNTPMIKLNHIPQSYGLKCEFLAKCEFTNIGGSVKDRMGLRMIEEAELSGKIKPGCTLIENTSGNAGIGIALAAAVKGYKFVATIPERMSIEKVLVMKSLGAEVVRCPTDAKWDSGESYMGVAKRLNEQIKGSFYLNQYSNIGNPLAHYDTLAEEIYDQCDGKLDVVVAGVGTGGTMTGVSSKLKQKDSNIKCVAVEPMGSVIADPEHMTGKPFLVEGIGKHFVPDTCVKKYADNWMQISDRHSFEMAKRLCKEEGLLVGGSSGTALYAAILYAQANGLDEKHRIVVIMADGLRNYVTKFGDDEWMVDHGFLSQEMYLNKDSALFGKTPRELELKQMEIKNWELTVKEAMKIFAKGAEVIPIIKEGELYGVVYEGSFLNDFETKKMKYEDTVMRLVQKEIPVVKLNTDLSIVQRMLSRHPYVFVEEKIDGKHISNVYMIAPKDLVKFHVDPKGSWEQGVKH